MLNFFSYIEPGYRFGEGKDSFDDVLEATKQYFEENLSKEKIAAELNMTTANVKYHTQQIYKRLGVSNKAGAVMEAGKRGLI